MISKYSGSVSYSCSACPVSHTTNPKVLQAAKRVSQLDKFFSYSPAEKAAS